MVIGKQGGGDEGVVVTREIWEDLGRIQGRSRDWCDWEGERNKAEKRREDIRGSREYIREREKGVSGGCLVFRSVRKRLMGMLGRGFKETEGVTRGEIEE